MPYPLQKQLRGGRITYAGQKSLHVTGDANEKGKNTSSSEAEARRAPGVTHVRLTNALFDDLR